MSHVATTWIVVPKLMLAIRQMASKSVAAGPTATTSGIIRATPTLAAEHGIVPSLGASGAVYACVTLTALGFPDTAISLIFPPTYPIPIQWGVGCMVGIDLLGVVFKWRFGYSLRSEPL